MKNPLKALKSKLWFKKVQSKEQGNLSQVFNLLDKKVYVDTNDEHRRNTKVTQVIIFAFLMMLIVCVMLMLLLISLLPLKEKTPYFVHFLPKEEQIVYVEPYKTTTKGDRRVKEWIARDYVKKRETIDMVTEEKRYQEVVFLSSEDIKQAFNDEYLWTKNPKGSPFKLAVENNYVRNIRIISSNILSDNQIQVEFEALQSLRTTGEVILTEIIIATLTFTKDDTRYKGSDYLNNPFGYVISDYSLGVKEYRGEYRGNKKTKQKNALNPNNAHLNINKDTTNKNISENIVNVQEQDTVTDNPNSKFKF